MVEFHNDQKSFSTWLEGLQHVKSRNRKDSLKEAKKFEVHFRDPVGSNNGPWLVLDPMEVRFVSVESHRISFVAYA